MNNLLEGTSGSPLRAGGNREYGRVERIKHTRNARVLRHCRENNNKRDWIGSGARDILSENTRLRGLGKVTLTIAYDVLYR